MQSRKKGSQSIQLFILLASCVAYLIEAVNSLRIGGITFDEHIEAWGLIDTLRHGGRILGGQASDFNDIVENLSFTG